MASMRLWVLMSVTLLSVAIAPGGASAQQGDDDPAKKQELTQEQTDKYVRRISAMLRVLDLQNGDKSEKQFLEKVAATLSGLSEKEMTQVMKSLEAAKVARGNNDDKK